MNTSSCKHISHWFLFTEFNFWVFFSGHPKNTSDNLNYIYTRQPLDNVMKTVAKEIVFGSRFELHPKNAINSE